MLFILLTANIVSLIVFHRSGLSDAVALAALNIAGLILHIINKIEEWRYSK